jgi:uncharacterized protein (DUF3820 family)
MSAAFTDETPMPWGKHKGVALANVPADYLIWIYENSKAHGKLAWYIKKNWDVLKKEVEKQHDNKG